MRVCVLGRSLSLAPLNETNVDKRNRDKKDDFSYTRRSPSALQKSNARPVTISPSGRVRIQAQPEP